MTEDATGTARRKIRESNKKRRDPFSIMTDLTPGDVIEELQKYRSLNSQSFSVVDSTLKEDLFEALADYQSRHKKRCIGKLSAMAADVIRAMEFVEIEMKGSPVAISISKATQNRKRKLGNERDKDDSRPDVRGANDVVRQDEPARALSGQTLGAVQPVRRKAVHGRA